MLKVFQISKFVELLASSISTMKSFNCLLGGLSILENDDRSASFLAMDATSGSVQLFELMTVVNQTILKFGTLQPYYDVQFLAYIQDPHFHVSLLRSSQNGEYLDKKLKCLMVKLDKTVLISVNAIHCRIGNKNQKVLLLS
jgi:hypothetical protein